MKLTEAVKPPLPGRRAFLSALGGLAIGAGALGWGARSAFAATLPATARRLDFHNTHTGERLSALYWRDGSYDKGALRDIFHILRDFRTGERHAIDLALLDLLVALHSRCRSRVPFEIISGYRSPTTNAQLAARSDGVAKKSLHLLGKAIDIRLGDVRLADLRAVAVAMNRGGVGYYPGSGFVHVDTGPVRAW